MTFLFYITITYLTYGIILCKNALEGQGAGAPPGLQNQGHGIKASTLLDEHLSSFNSFTRGYKLATGESGAMTVCLPVKEPWWVRFPLPLSKNESISGQHS